MGLRERVFVLLCFFFSIFGGSEGKRMTEEMKSVSVDVLRQLHKAELHCHLDGSMRVSTILELAEEQGVKLPANKEEELKELVCVGASCQSLEEYLQAFSITLSVLQVPYALTRAMYEVCEDAEKDGVSYIEVRFSPVLHTDKGMTVSQVMEAVCEGQFLAERKLGIVVRVIVCGMRQMPPSVSLQMAEMAWRYKNKGVCGFDLAGPEAGFEASKHKEAFNLIRSRCLNVTLHSGEGAGWESVEDSIQTCGVHRIGHGVRMVENMELLQVVANRRIAIESCPTSNFQTKAIDSLESHPIRLFFDRGIVVVPCCDNWTVSDVTLSSEYDVIQKIGKFDFTELLRMMDNGFASAFLVPLYRVQIRRDALRHNLKLLHSLGYDAAKAASHPQFSHLLGLPNSPTFDYFLGKKVAQWGLDSVLDLETISQLPKADLHCTLVGSVGQDLVRKGLKERKGGLASFGVKGETKEQFEGFWRGCESKRRAQLTREALQTREMLRLGVMEVLETSFEDGVIYVELALRPFSHSSSGQMTPCEVMEVALKAISDFEKQHAGKFWCGLLPHISFALDDPVAVSQIALMAIEHFKKGHSLCGVGFYGHQELKEEDYKFYLSTFKKLSKFHVPVSISAGMSDEKNVIPALQWGGAQRISGGTQIHNAPRLMTHLATHSVPLEIGLTDIFEEHEKQSWIQNGSSLRLFLDFQIPLVVCSFRRKRSLSEEIMQIVKACSLDAQETLTLIANGFWFNFQPYEVRKEIFDYARKMIFAILKEKGLTSYGRRVWCT